ncbi:MAG: hypothetical protein R6V32_00165, partial [Bacteroidales bacterium]
DGQGRAGKAQNYIIPKFKISSKSHTRNPKHDSTMARRHDCTKARLHESTMARWHESKMGRVGEHKTRNPKTRTQISRYS